MYNEPRLTLRGSTQISSAGGQLQLRTKDSLVSFILHSFSHSVFLLEMYTNLRTNRRNGRRQSEPNQNKGSVTAFSTNIADAVCYKGRVGIVSFTEVRLVQDRICKQTINWPPERRSIFEELSRPKLSFIRKTETCWGRIEENS